MWRRHNGEPPTYAIVAASEGRYTADAMEERSDMLHTESTWVILPLEFVTQELLLHALRCLNAALCTKLETQVIPREHGVTVSGYRILSKKSAGSDAATTERLIFLYSDHPCVLCFKWCGHIRKYASVQKMLSADSLAELMFMANELELNNIDTETKNTCIHRSIRKCLQQKIASLDDVAAQFVLYSCKKIHCYIFGEREYPAMKDTEAERDKSRKKKRSGGGGLDRAFISHHAQSMKTETGAKDFAAIWALYKSEEAKESSDL